MKKAARLSALFLKSKDGGQRGRSMARYAALCRECKSKMPRRRVKARPYRFIVLCLSIRIEAAG